MKVVLFILVLCVMYISVYSWTAIIPYTKVQSDHGGHCYTDTYKIGALKKGERKRIEMCAVADCLDSKDISILGCGTIVVEPPCYAVPGNLTKPYPDCCFEIKCSNKVKEEEVNLNLL